MVNMNLRKAALEDGNAVVKLYEEAKGFLRSQGVDQWQDGYPNEETFRRDVAEGNAWVLEEDGQVVATAYLGIGREPTYAKIYEGDWAADPAEYAFLHRIAVAGSCKGKGAPGIFFRQLEKQARERGLSVIRGDTHRDNRIMQRVMEKNGLTCRGIIYLEDGSSRLAFEKILK